MKINVCWETGVYVTSKFNNSFNTTNKEKLMRVNLLQFSECQHLFHTEDRTASFLQMIGKTDEEGLQAATPFKTMSLE